MVVPLQMHLSQGMLFEEDLEDMKKEEDELAIESV